MDRSMQIRVRRISSFLKTVSYHFFILSLWPVLITSCGLFGIYRKLVDSILRFKFGEAYGGLVETADAAYLIKDTTKIAITSVLVVKSDRQRDLLEIIKVRLKDKIFDEPQRYPKLTSGQYEYGGYAYWIKNDYQLNDCVKLLTTDANQTLNEECLKKVVGEIIGKPFPKDNVGHWEIVVSNRHLQEYKQDGFYYYPVVTRFSHAIADGTSLIALLIDIVGDINAQNYSENVFIKFTSVPKQSKNLKFLTKVVQGFKLTLYIATIGAAKAFKLSQLRKYDDNALHGPSHSGHKIAVWCAENTTELLPAIKQIKNRIPGMKFSYVIMTAISASLTNFFRRNSQPVPDMTTSLVTILLHFPKLDSSKPARLENKTSVAIIDLPTNKSNSITKLLREVKLEAEEPEYEDVMINYFLLTKIAGLFPLSLSSKIIGRGTYTNFITNVPGGSRIKLLDGCELENVIPLGPNLNNVGLSISVLSYDDRLQLGISVDKAILSSQEEAQKIADDIFESLKLLDLETQ